METNQLILKSLRILSISEKSAKIVTFHPQRNLITGENDVGKSSIIKSIYHTLGADVKFDELWAPADPTCLLSFSYKGIDYSILRTRNLFGIFDSNLNLIKAFDSITKGLSPFFANFFFNKLKLKQVKSNTRIHASPAIQFLPFYIDQDKSWNNAWNAFQGLGMYSSFKTDLINFVTGIKPNEWYLLSEKIDGLAANIKELQDEVIKLNSARKAVVKQLPKANFNIDITAFKKEINKLLVQLSSLKSTEDTYRHQLLKLKSDEIFLDNEINLLEKSIQEINKDYEYSLKNLDDEITCPTCDAKYDNSMISRFGLLEDIDKCRVLLSEHLENKKELRLKISTLEAKLHIERTNVQKITAILNEKRGKVRLKDLIENESSKHIKNVFEKSGQEYAERITAKQTEHAALKKDRTQLNNTERKENIVSTFNSFFGKFLSKLNVHILSSNGLKNIPNSVSSQGSDTPRALLAYYYAIIFTSREFTNLPLFPLVIDSPNQQDQDPQNRKKIIQFIFDNTPKDFQLILGTVELHGVDYDGHIISPSTKLKLLNTEEYDDSYNVIMPLLDKLHEGLILNNN